MRFDYGKMYCIRMKEAILDLSRALSNDDVPLYRSGLLCYFNVKRESEKNIIINELKELPESTLMSSDIIYPYLIGCISQIKHISKKIADKANWNDEHNFEKLLNSLWPEFRFNYNNPTNIYAIIISAESAVKELYENESSTDRKSKIIDEYSLFLKQLSDACFCFDNKNQFID